MRVLALVTRGATGCAALPDRMISTSSSLFGLVSGKLDHKLALWDGSLSSLDKGLSGERLSNSGKLPGNCWSGVYPACVILSSSEHLQWQGRLGMVLN
jgi:hypothetical protein